MADKYSSMTELFKNEVEGTDYEVITEDNDSKVLLTSIHGGGIEVGSTELVEAIRELGNYNIYEFKGLKSSNNSSLHVTSTNYDAPQLLELIKETDYAVSIHGASGEEPICYMGGNDVKLRNAIWSALEDIGIKVQISPPNIIGENDDNITNRTRKSKGVQLELTTALRQSFFKNGDSRRFKRENKDNWTDIIKNMAKAIHDTVQESIKYDSNNVTTKYKVKL